ncbi:MAG: hypothetical protein ABSE82_09875 [Nitrososphaerales archaeon]
MTKRSPFVLLGILAFAILLLGRSTTIMAASNPTTIANDPAGSVPIYSYFTHVAGLLDSSSILASASHITTTDKAVNMFESINEQLALNYNIVPMTSTNNFHFTDADYYWTDCGGSSNDKHAFAEAVPIYGSGDVIEIHYSFPSSTYEGIYPFCGSVGFTGMQFTEHDITQGWTSISYTVNLYDYVTVTVNGNYCYAGDCWSTAGNLVIYNCYVGSAYQYCE